MFFLHILILYHLLEEVIFTLYYLYTTTKTSENDNENTAQYTESVGQDIYLLQMSLDRLELGIDAGVKILIVIAFLLCVQAGAKIAEMFMHWFTR